jgi:hypothetical protein
MRRTKATIIIVLLIAGVLMGVAAVNAINSHEQDFAGYYTGGQDVSLVALCDDSHTLYWVDDHTPTDFASRLSEVKGQ